MSYRTLATKNKEAASEAPARTTHSLADRHCCEGRQCLLTTACSLGVPARSAQEEIDETVAVDVPEGWGDGSAVLVDPPERIRRTVSALELRGRSIASVFVEDQTVAHIEH